MMLPVRFECSDLAKMVLGLPRKVQWMAKRGVPPMERANPLKVISMESGFGMVTVI